MKQDHTELDPPTASNASSNQFAQKIAPTFGQGNLSRAFSLIPI
jgi:hypothetical protein